MWVPLRLLTMFKTRLFIRRITLSSDPVFKPTKYETRFLGLSRIRKMVEKALCSPPNVAGMSQEQCDSGNASAA